MIIQTILNGRMIIGTVKKPIAHPYTGSSPDSLAYTSDIHIDAFSPLSNVEAFRSELIKYANAISRYLTNHAAKITALASDETGSPVSYQEHDLDGVQAFLQKIHTLEIKLPKKYHFEAKGNILLILSANEPIITSTILALSSLFMGNVVFVKPSSKTPSYAHLLVKELSKIPSLRKRVHYLLIDSIETERLIRAKAFDLVLSFGSRSTNKKLGVTCAESEVEFLPESEGNDWAYVDKDYQSPKKISNMIVESFVRHNGQMCNAVRGVMVHASVYNELISHIKDTFATLTVGSPHLTSTRIGALIAGTQDRAQSMAHEAAARARDVWRAEVNNGAFAPMVILDPEDTSSIFSESIFAPVLWIKKVNNHSEAVSFYQEKNKHGLGFSVFSKDNKVIDECTHHIRAGRINVNKHPLDVGLFDPLGGIKLSGHNGPSLWVEKVSNRKYIN